MKNALFLLSVFCLTPVLADTFTLGVPDGINIHEHQFPKIQQAFEQSGHQIIFRKLPSLRSLKLSNDGVLDGEIARHEFITREYPNLIPVQYPLWEGGLYVYGKTGLTIRTVADLQQYRLVTADRIEYFKLVPPALKPSHVARDIDLAVQMIVTGRADFTIAPPLFHQEYPHLETKVIRYLDHPVVNMRFFTFLHEKHKDQIPALENAYRQLLKTATEETKK